MTTTTITGALTMSSTSGDGAQLLTEAAAILNALAQMGVQMAVEINLRPLGAEQASTPSTASTQSIARTPARGSADDITLYEGHPSLAPVDPTQAAPAQPEEPQWNLTPHPVRSSSSATNHEWRKLSRAQRHALLHEHGQLLYKRLGHMPTMKEWDDNRPTGYPTASGLPKQFNVQWTTLTSGWAARESV